MKLTLREMTVAGMLAAVCMVMGIVPGLGLIPVPTPAQHATIMHVPAILAGVAAGPVVGLMVGLIFGIFSFLRATMPAFADPLVAILPRLLIGVAAAFAFRGVHRWGLSWGLLAAAIAGTLTNTVLVLGMMVLRGYLAPKVALTAGLVHGVPEVVVAGMVVTAVGLALFRAGVLHRTKRQTA